jgi:Fur family zinc uptake transcriptional regulator
MMTPKLTKNQQVVLDALRACETPMSAYQILDVDSVRSKGLKAPLTIYRALDKLIEAGLVHRIESLNAFVSCDQEHHAESPAFMICTECKHIIEVGTRSVQKTLMKQAAEAGFEVEQLHVEVSGRCRNCAH